MAQDTFSSSLRIQLMGTGNDAGIWGTIANTQFQNLEAAITGNNGGAIPIDGLASYTLTVNNGTADQARQFLYPFTGVLTAPCGVLIPGVVKFGWAVNLTSGGQNVILSTGGGGTNLTIPPGGTWVFFYCDGTNVAAPVISFPNLGPISAPSINVGSLSVSGQSNINTLVTTGTATIDGNLSLPNGNIANVQINGSSGAAIVDVNMAPAATSSTNCFRGNILTAACGFALWQFTGSIIGSITSLNGNSTLYNTTSDRQLKDDGGPIGELAGAIIDRLVPRWFRWKSRPKDDYEPGFFAQEVWDAYPWAVQPGLGDPSQKHFQPWQMDAAKLMPIVIAELISLRRRVLELERDP